MMSYNFHYHLFPWYFGPNILYDSWVNGKCKEDKEISFYFFQNKHYLKAKKLLAAHFNLQWVNYLGKEASGGKKNIYLLSKNVIDWALCSFSF